MFLVMCTENLNKLYNFEREAILLKLLKEVIFDRSPALGLGFLKCACADATKRMGNRCLKRRLGMYFNLCNYFALDKRILMQ